MTTTEIAVDNIVSCSANCTNSTGLFTKSKLYIVLSQILRNCYTTMRKSKSAIVITPPDSDSDSDYDTAPYATVRCPASICFCCCITLSRCPCCLHTVYFLPPLAFTDHASKVHASKVQDIQVQCNQVQVQGNQVQVQGNS